MRARDFGACVVKGAFLGTCAAMPPLLVVLGSELMVARPILLKHEGWWTREWHSIAGLVVTVVISALVGGSVLGALARHIRHNRLFILSVVAACGYLIAVCASVLTIIPPTHSSGYLTTVIVSTLAGAIAYGVIAAPGLIVAVILLERWTRVATSSAQ